jgi:phosphate transport system permease protein
VYRVLFPAAKNGLLAASMLGVGRAVGETMAVWMASGGTENIPDNLFSFAALFERMKALTATIASEMPDTAHGDEHYMMLFVIGILLLLISVFINVTSDLVIKGVKKRNE